MKKVFTQYFALLCAVYFLVAGSGYNIIKYCCDSCAKEGIETIANSSCEDIHHAKQHQEDGCCTHKPANRTDDLACSDVSHIAEDDCCHLLRLETDTPLISLDNIVVDTEWEIEFLSFFYALLTSPFIPEEVSSFIPPNNPPNYSGRDILTYHAVLLI